MQPMTLFHEAAEDFLFVFVFFAAPSGSLCCSAGVTAIGGSKSRSSLCFGCSALVFDPVASQHVAFSKLVHASFSPCMHIPGRKLATHLPRRACQQVIAFLSRSGEYSESRSSFTRRADFIPGCDKSSEVKAER